MRTVTFCIEGMNCEGCAETLKGLIERQPGVRKAEISFGERQARVLYDPQAVGEEHLIGVIQKPGFHVVGNRWANARRG